MLRDREPVEVQKGSGGGVMAGRGLDEEANGRILDALQFKFSDDALWRKLLRESFLDVMKVCLRVSAAEKESDGWSPVMFFRWKRAVWVVCLVC